MIFRGLSSFRACTQVACEVRVCLDLFTEGNQCKRLLESEIVTFWTVIHFRSTWNATFVTFIRGLKCN